MPLPQFQIERLQAVLFEKRGVVEEQVRRCGKRVHQQRADEVGRHADGEQAQKRDRTIAQKIERISLRKPAAGDAVKVKYKGTLLADLPSHYLGWFAQKGFPKGQLGRLLALMHEVDQAGARRFGRFTQEHVGRPFAIILDGIPGTAMPPWRPLISEADARWIADYLKTEKVE